MNVHKMARLTPLRRGELVAVVRGGVAIAVVARQFAVSRQTVYKWLRRWRGEGRPGLQDRSSRPRRCPRRLARLQRRQVERLRRRRWSSVWIARELRLPLSTVVGVQRQLGLNRLRHLEPPRPVHRYEWPRPGDLLHLDVKKLGRIGRVGHRIHGDRRTRVRGIGWEYVHVAIDDHTRLAYVEVLPDELGATTAGFLTRALAWYRRQHVRVVRLLTDNGGAYRSHAFAASVATTGVEHRRTRPYCPRTNGKAERFIRTLLSEWAYQRPYRRSAARTAALTPYLHWYNTQRPHTALGWRTPQQRLRTVNNVLVNNT